MSDSPGQSYEGVIEKLLDDHDDLDTSLCSEWAKGVKEAISEFRRGETLTKDEIIKICPSMTFKIH